MRLSKDDIERIQKWMQSNNYDYVELSQGDSSSVRGYKIDVLKLREKVKQQE